MQFGALKFTCKCIEIRSLLMSSKKFYDDQTLSQSDTLELPWTIWSFHLQRSNTFNKRKNAKGISFMVKSNTNFTSDIHSPRVKPAARRNASYTFLNMYKGRLESFPQTQPVAESTFLFSLGAQMSRTRRIEHKGAS